MLNSNGQCVPCVGYYDAVSQQCLECPVGSSMVKDNITKQCRCPESAPIYVNGNCKACSNTSYYYDVNSSSCQLCPNGMTVSYSNNTCMCFYTQIYVNNSCTCPADKPYLTNSGCVACYLPKYYNTNTRECITCPPGT